jgi:hypothetical protein
VQVFQVVRKKFFVRPREKADVGLRVFEEAPHDASRQNLKKSDQILKKSDWKEPGFRLLILPTSAYVEPNKSFRCRIFAIFRSRSMGEVRFVAWVLLGF